MSFELNCWYCSQPLVGPSNCVNCVNCNNSNIDISYTLYYSGEVYCIYFQFNHSKRQNLENQITSATFNTYSSRISVLYSTYKDGKTRSVLIPESVLSSNLFALRDIKEIWSRLNVFIKLIGFV